MIDTHININIVLLGRNYKLKVEPSEEAMVRQAAKEINDKVLDYQSKFPSKDKQDFLIMILLQQKVDSFRKSNVQSSSDDWNNKLDALDQLLSQHLKSL